MKKKKTFRLFLFGKNALCIKNVSSKLFHINTKAYSFSLYNIEFDTQPEEYIFSPVDLCLNFYFFPSEIDRIDLRGSKLNNQKK